MFDVTAWYRYLFPGTPVPNSLGDYDSTQVDISRKMSRFKIRLRDREEARRSRGGGCGDRPPPIAWGWILDTA